MCEVIKKKNKDPVFDRALSFIFFQKQLDIVPASADEWLISANDDAECIYVRMCAIVMENQRQSINGDNIGQLMEIHGKRVAQRIL